MTVTCPNCETQFNIDDKVYSPGRKARCSVCGFMFILPAMPTDAPPKAPSAPSPSAARAAKPVALDEMDTGGSQTTELDALLAEQERQEAETAARMAESLPNELEDNEYTEVPGSDPGFDDEEPAKKAPAKKKGGCLKRLILLLALLLCLGGLGAGVYIIYFQGNVELPFKLPFSLPGASSPAEDPVGERIADIDKVKDLLLIDVSHKYIQNVKLGPLVVISGKVKNNFPVPKEMIRVEASLLDKKGKVLATQQQFAGIVVPDLQLQVLGQKELAAALDNRFDMLANNINIQPGVEVQFMVVFVYPPSNMAEYTVIVADVADPPNLAPQTPASQQSSQQSAGQGAGQQ